MKKIIYPVLFLAIIFIYTPAFASYKIILKNGKDFTVSNYTEADGKIRFYMNGGLIELDRSIIESIKQIKARSGTYESAPEDAVKKDSTVGSDSQREAQPTAEKGEGVKTKKQDAESRLREIAKKKEEMKAEAGKLSEEKKKIEEDIKKEGMVTSIRAKREFEKRAAEITERIRKFNEELNRVDDEEARLVKELQELSAPKKPE
ncbi:MAG: hypothetical protein Q7T83_07560 [Thermodesulfovibrionales bacterium]|nr:hypothetical protein [Thermodesulfovibrionales bacterium]